MTTHPDPARADVEQLPTSIHRKVDLPDIKRRWNRLQLLPFCHEPSRSGVEAERRNIEFVLIWDDVPWLVNQVATLRARAERAEAALREMDTASKSTNYESAAHKDLAIGRILSDALAAPTEPEGGA